MYIVVIKVKLIIILYHIHYKPTWLLILHILTIISKISMDISSHHRQDKTYVNFENAIKI